VKIPEKFIIIKDLSCKPEALVSGLREITTKKGSVFKLVFKKKDWYLFDDIIASSKKEIPSTRYYLDNCRIAIARNEAAKVFKFLLENKYIIILSWIEELEVR
jgi:hypothetical protein